MNQSKNKVLDIGLRVTISGLILTCLFSLFLHRKIMNLDFQGAHAWRQTQTMWNVRNFVRYDRNIFNPRVSYFNGGTENILRYEFPIMQYCIAIVHMLFGEHILLTRGFLWILSCCSVIGFYFLSRQINNHRATALFSAFFLSLSPLFFYYSYNPIPDCLALCCGIWYLFYAIKYESSQRHQHLILAGLFLLFSTLAKLPYLMFSIVSIFFFAKRFLVNGRFTKRLLFENGGLLAIISPALLWYIWVIPSWEGNSVLKGVFENGLEVSQYLYILKHHLNHVFPKLLLYPAVWLICIFGFIHFIISSTNTRWLTSLILITFFYFFIELNAINTIHDYYMMPFLPWLFIIVSIGIRQLFNLNFRIVSATLIILIITASHTTYNSATPLWSLKHDGFNEDVYVFREELSNIIPDDEVCIILNDRSQSVFSYNIDKMGHIFYDNELPVLWIGDMIDNYGATYLYSDSRKLEADPEFLQFVDSLLLSAGSINVFQLRAPRSSVIRNLPFYKVN